MNSTECRGCDTQMTWAEQRRQFGRACAAGLTAEEAQMPHCQRCTTTMLHWHGLKSPKRVRRLF